MNQIQQLIDRLDQVVTDKAVMIVVEETIKSWASDLVKSNLPLELDSDLVNISVEAGVPVREI